MRLRSHHLAILVAGVFVVGIGITMAFNLWRTESTKVPAKFSTGVLAGEYNPGDIRGSYAFSDIVAVFDVPLDVLARAFGVSGEDDPGAVKCKDMEERYGEMEGGEIGTDSVRYFVALYTGLPYTPEEDTLLLSSALGLLRDRVEADVLEGLQARTVRSTDARPADAAAAEHIEEDRVVKGKTTFGDLLSWGLQKAEIEDILGGAIGKSGVTVRDHVVNAGMEFSPLKTKLQELLDAQ